ncbi:uncharacterized protein C8Q71DRAFT_773324 [Rhodofomes roseus]|uniref:Uncharacterized protein n=1 Tax=Rhodofomes roseus TaxID=34475 RepID=A0ABQ8JX21_9APHY|nr:uncharacterized protein C8Q71DRAFT_793202 [Rhodofomes roseus]XP_047776166.1 uncharacterized protein C8Q71DRAFT_773324 [Rhodofomes roseus]KAH9828559.1 hypothetical protein C8Q71DRAFT_793202 [Rhodofomes roseus]KAH9833426.1 hypothetical protein C8Q71DRAFT_773324 [Rhodofomes roseus]
MFVSLSSRVCAIPALHVIAGFPRGLQSWTLSTIHHVPDYELISNVYDHNEPRELARISSSSRVLVCTNLASVAHGYDSYPSYRANCYYPGYARSRRYVSQQ